MSNVMRNVPPELSEVCSLCLHIHRVQGFTRGHEQPVPPRAAEADVGAGLGEANEAKACGVGSEDLDAGPRACPDISIDIAADAVGRRRLAVFRIFELHESLAVPQRLAVD